MEVLLGLDISGLAVGNEGCELLANGIARSASLRRLVAARCSIGDVGAEAVGLFFQAILKNLGPERPTHPGSQLSVIRKVHLNFHAYRKLAFDII